MNDNLFHDFVAFVNLDHIPRILMTLISILQFVWSDIEIAEVRSFSIPVPFVERSGKKENFAQCLAL